MVKTRFKISNEDLKALAATIAAEAGRVVQNNFGDLRPLIQESIDSEIEKNKTKFIPNGREAAELGVGSFGGIASEKTETAYWAMKIIPDFGESVSTFSVRAERSVAAVKAFIGKKKIGVIKFDINKKAFYEAPASNIATPDTDAFPSIPWMKWFVEGAIGGAKIQGARFSDKRPIPETSRTGRGIMIEGGVWDFKPRTTALIEKLIDKIEKRINRDLKNTKVIQVLRK